MSTAVAQQRASEAANIGASIVIPVSIAKTDIDLNSYKNPQATAGIASKGGINVRKSVKDNSILAVASFTVSGEKDYIYSVTLESSKILASEKNASLSVNSFTSEVVTGNLGSGTKTFSVAANMTAKADQSTDSQQGEFPFTVMVNYN